MAALCCKTGGCVAFSWNHRAASNDLYQLFSTTVVNSGGTPGPGWKTWTMTDAPKPPVDPPASSCAAGAKFCQTLHLANRYSTIGSPLLIP